MQIYKMDTLVASCRTVQGALDLARFMESRFPFDSSIHSEQLHKFNVVMDVDGKIAVHSTVAVNDLGREDFKKFVVDFTTLKLRKPVQSMRPAASMRRAA